MQPFNFFKWLEENKKNLKPPICNKIIYQDHDFILMVVGGPNIRKDFHVNQSAEIFYQYQGDMNLKIIENDQVKNIIIKEGELFQLPPNIPHSPQRFANTIGIVIENKRRVDQIDKLLWRCDNCSNILYQKEFNLQCIEKDLIPIIDNFAINKTNKICNKCNTELAL